MGTSRTWLVKAQTIASQPALRNVLIRLMLSVNDIALASDANDQWATTTERRRAFRRDGARMYFVRILLAHIFEALDIVREISQSSTLKAAVDRCDAQTIQAFRDLESFIASPESKVLDTLRNRVSFHYDRRLPEKNLGEIAELCPSGYWPYSMGTEALDWYFKLADAVVDRMVIRDAFGLKKPRSSQRTKETEVIAGRLQEISITFTNFAAHFVRHYSQ